MRSKKARNRKLAYVLFILMFSLPAIFFSTAQEVDDTSTKIGSSDGNNPFIIRSIEIKGSETMPPDTILGILQTRVGEEVSLKLIRDDVKELYKLGQFSNIQVDSSGGPDGIHLTFILEEWPKTKDVIISGNEEIDDGKIKDVLTISSGRSTSGKLLHENRAKILSLYQNKGYYLAEVKTDIEKVESDDAVTVKFNIEEGNKIEVEEIDIVGNRRVSDRDIRKQMKTKKGKRFDDEYFEGDLKAIIEYYHENGFINARIINADKDFNEDRTGLVVNIELEEGPQFRIGSIAVNVVPFKDEDQIYSEKEILEESELEEGDIFSHINFQMALAKINKIYGDKGRVSIQINEELEYKNEDEVVDITLNIAEGGPAYIESVPINWVSETNEEPHKTKEYVIRRELERFDIKKGEVFSYQNITDARRKILTLGSFIRGAQPRAVPVSSMSEDGTQLVTVNFDIEESRQSGMFSIAGGYGSDGGVFGALDIWDDNIFGRAWRMQLRGEIGTRERRTGQIVFSTPWIFNNPISLAASLYSKRRSTTYYPGEDEEALYRDESVGGAITIGRPLTNNIDLSIGLRNENVSYKELMGEVWEEMYAGRTRSVKLILDHDSRQFITSMFDPSSGLHNRISSEFSGWGGDVFQKYMVESSIFIPTWWKLVLVFHMQAGYFTGDYPNLLNLRYERFYLGGIDTVRGYQNYSIRPSNGYEEYGGNQMALLNVEYRFPITDMLRGLIFFDAGQTWADNILPWDNFKPRKSVGIGLRIDLLGALARIEYGIPLDPAMEGDKIKGGKIEFDIGPAF
ncbi:outer membrane protein assembly factor BamA [Candidatus Poribacteria bacterium]|nr:outer membrane protein assembly factor BamA [Candidatus Poribacteria bacterium]